MVHLATLEPVEEDVVIYLNRLSDLMFVLARALNEGREGDEPQWRGMEKPQT